MKGWLTMSSLFNKEDEDKLLPPEPCADQYVCVCLCVLGGGPLEDLLLNFHQFAFLFVKALSCPTWLTILYSLLLAISLKGKAIITS